jgi:hypothetical protein
MRIRILVLCEHLLQFAFLAAALALQITLRIRQFVFVEVQLGSGQLKLALDVCPFHPFRVVRSFREVFDLRLFRIHLRLSLLDPLLELHGFCRGRRRLCGGIAQGSRKCEIDFVIR